MNESSHSPQSTTDAGIKTFYFAGQFFPNGVQDLAVSLIKHTNNDLVDQLDSRVNYVVLGMGSEAEQAQRDAERLNVDCNADIKMIDLIELCQLAKPGAKTLRQNGLSWNQSIEAFRGLAGILRQDQLLDLRQQDLSGSNISGASFRMSGFGSSSAAQCLLEGVNLSSALAKQVTFPALADVNFDGACLSEASFSDLENCSFKNSDLTKAILLGTNVRSCDFSGSTATRVKANCCAFTGDCTFTGVSLREADLTATKFSHAELSGVDLSDSMLLNADLTEARMCGALLSNACFDEAKLVGADLTNADLREASFVGADLSLCTVDGANFTSANLAGANLGHIDQSKAIGLKEALADVPQAEFGAATRELLQVARQAGKFSLSLNLFYRKAQIKLELKVSNSANDINIDVCNVTENGRDADDNAVGIGYSYCMSCGPSSGIARMGIPPWPSRPLEDVILDVVRRLGRGRLIARSISARSSKSAVTGKTLKALATAACHELFQSST